METQSKFIRVFAGSEITVNLLKAELEQACIMSNVVNEYEESNFRGFSTGTPYSVICISSILTSKKRNLSLMNS